MCFSASASFSAGVVLTVIGMATIKKAKNPEHYLFASIPFIFGIQQLAEGILWLTLADPNYISIQKVFTYIFLFFAQIVWPIWVPIAILLLEHKDSRQNSQKLLVAAGLIIGFYLAFCLFTYQVEAKIIGHHIAYFQNYPKGFRNLGLVLYALATIAPPFFSHIKRMWLLGVTILISYVVTAIFYDQYILSVWCFFSSVISLSIYSIMLELARIPRKIFN